MARTRSPQNQAIIAACREHMLLNGAHDWPAVRARFPGVSQGVFYRMVDLARLEIEASAVASQSPGAVRAAQQRIRTRIDAPEVTAARIKVHLPTAPSPAVVASMSGAAQAKAFDFLGFFHRVVLDSEMLRDKAMAKNEDGTERVANPNMLNASLRTRLSVMDTYLSTLGELYNLDKLRELYNLVIEEVGKESPQAQQAILARLRRLNDERGLTMAARPT